MLATGSASSCIAVALAAIQAFTWWAGEKPGAPERVVYHPVEPQICQCECTSFAPPVYHSGHGGWGLSSSHVSVQFTLWVVVSLFICLILSLSIIRCCFFLLIRTQTQSASIQTISPMLCLAHVQASVRTASVAVQTESVQVVLPSPAAFPGLEGSGSVPVTPSRLREWRAQQQQLQGA